MDDVLAFVDPAHFVPLDNVELWDGDGLHFSPAGSQALGEGLADLTVKEFSKDDDDYPILDAISNAIEDIRAFLFK